MQERIRKKLIMPDLCGLGEKDAQIMLTNQGFQRGTVRFVETYDELGTVVTQHPMKGQLVDSTTPVHLHVCKRSYIRHLPQIYQVDTSVGNGFLREYLWIFQHVMESVTDKLDQAHRYYRPYDAPEDFLPWLASWVALAVDIDWPETKKRKLIKAAAQMYAYRGTRRAMKEVLAIFVGKEPKIVENAWPYQGFRVGVSSTVAEDTIILPPINLDHCFMVHIPMPPEDITEEMVVKIHNIINLEKPAHSTYFLQFKTEDVKARPQVFMQIGIAATIGMTELRYDLAPDGEPAPVPAAPDTETASESTKE